MMFIYTGRFHSPNCDCDRMRRLKNYMKNQMRNKYDFETSVCCE